MIDEREPKPPRITDEIETEIEEFIDLERRLFLYTRSPLKLWETYGWCRRVGLGFPDWILEEFDAIGMRLFTEGDTRSFPDAFSVKPRSKTLGWKDVLLEIFGFYDSDSRGGPQEPHEAFRRQSLGIELAFRVRLLILDGHKLTEAYGLVAGEFLDVTELNVRRAWRDHSQFARSIEVCQLQKWATMTNEARADFDRRVYEFATDL